MLVCSVSVTNVARFGPSNRIRTVKMDERDVQELKVVMGVVVVGIVYRGFGSNGVLSPLN